MKSKLICFFLLSFFLSDSYCTAFFPDIQKKVEKKSTHRVMGGDQNLKLLEARTLQQQSLLVSANKLLEQQRYPEAEDNYLRAIGMAERRSGIVKAAENGLAVVYYKTGRYAEAEELYQQVLFDTQASLGPNHPDVATILNNLGMVYRKTGHYDKAEPLFKQALDIRENALAPEHPDIAASLNNLAWLYFKTGHYAQTEPLYLQSLEILEKIHEANHPLIAGTQNDLAGLYLTTGRYAEAETYFKKALMARTATLGEEHSDVAASLNNLAELYRIMGRYEEAISLYQQSLEVLKEVLGDEHPDVATCLYNLAVVHRFAGQYVEAESFFKQALVIRERALGEIHPDIVLTQNSLAELYLTTDRYKEAEPLFLQALDAGESCLGGGHPDVAEVLNNLAKLYRATGGLAEAEPLCQRALVIANDAGDPELLYRVQNNYSGLLNQLNNPEAAIFFGKQSINTIQSMRQNISGLGKETLQSFDETIEEHYLYLSGLLVAQGRLPEAERVLDLLKEQEYFQFVQRNSQIAPTASTASLTAFETQQKELLNAASTPLAGLAAELRQLEEKEQLTAEEEARLDELDEKLEQASADFIQALKQVVASLGATRASEGENLREAGALQDTLRELGQGTVALYTLVDQDNYVLIQITPDYRRAYTVDITTAELAHKITELRNQLKNPASDPRPLAKQLYDILLPEQARQELTAANAVTLMWHLDGPLRYLPLAALYDGNHYLVENYRNTLFTTASLLNLGKAPQSSWKGLGLGTSKARTIGATTFSALDSVPAELGSIIRQGDETAGTIPGQRYLDESFTWESLQKNLKRKGKYPLVHIASHFSLEPGDSSKSFLLTGSGDPISLEQISLKDNLFGGVDLLTLSACETAYSGGKGADGREIDGLSIMAQQKGAKAVIATLWPVADTSTALLMGDFYRLREEQNLPKAEALRQAQLALLNGETADIESSQPGRGKSIRFSSEKESATAPVDPGKSFAHPYYWAPIVLMGNWL